MGVPQTPGRGAAFVVGIPGGTTEDAYMTTSIGKFFALIIERDGQELARDVIRADGAADARRQLMQLARRYEINSFDEPIHCQVEELSE